MQYIPIQLQNEDGELVEKSDVNFVYAIAALWKRGSEKEYPWLWAIDPYGDTTFNVHQAPKVIEELNRLLPKVEDPTAKEAIQKTIDFMGKIEQHLYIKFIGD